MEDGRAGAPETDDEHRLDDLLLGDPGIALAVVDVGQAVDDVPERPLPGDVLPHRVQPGVPLQRAHEQPQRLEEGPGPEVLQTAGTRAGFRD